MSLYSRLVKRFLVDETKLPNLDALASNEHFIPIYFSDILEKVMTDGRLNEEERNHFKTLAVMLSEHYHLDYHQCALDLKHSFAPFDPDAEVEWQPDYSEEYQEKCRKIFEKDIEQFLVACNFCELDRELQEIILRAPYPGILPLVPDYRKLESMKIYYRGTVDTEHKAKALFILRKTYSSKKIKRIFVLARYKKEYDNLMIVKVFRDIPVENLKVVLPAVRLTMPIFDRIKVGGTGLISVGITLYKFFVAVTVAPILFALTFVGFIGAFVKALFGFLNSRTKCLKTFSESLYHKSLASNMGAINLLVEQAEAQEVKEAFLAYYILYVLRDENLTQDELDQRVETWLQKNFGFYIDFEVDDALRKLVDKKLVGAFQTADGNKKYYKVYDLPSALRRLDEMWDNHHTENNFGDASFDRFAGLSALEQVGVTLDKNPRKICCKHNNRYNLRKKAKKCVLAPKSRQVQKCFNRKKK